MLAVVTSQLGKADGRFLPLEAFMASGTVKSNAQEEHVVPTLK